MNFNMSVLLKEQFTLIHIWWKYNQPQAVQDVDVCFFLEQIWRI